MPLECARELSEMVKEHQPQCLVSSRIGAGMGEYTSMGDNQLPSEYMEELVESPITLNNTWGYKSFDNDWKSADEVQRILEKCRRCGANLLLNIGPDHLGRFPVPAINVLKDLAKKRS